jgi:hypothetical protein
MLHPYESMPTANRNPIRWSTGRSLLREYAARLERLPDNLQDTATAEALRAISELDLSELQAIVPPRGFGRD